MKKAKELIKGFKYYIVTRIPRTENAKADLLAKLASTDEDDIPRSVPVEYVAKPSIDEPVSSIVQMIDSEPSWIDPIVRYLNKGELPEDRAEARRLKIRASRYTILNRTLYKKGYYTPLLRCLNPSKADYVLRKIYEGICENYSGGQSLAHKFGIPQTIVTDNGKQFDNNSFREMCGNLGIRNVYSSHHHPQTNEQVEAINKIIKHHLRTKFDRPKRAWIEELLKILWAYRPTAQTATGETPFSLTYGSEAVTPVEIGLPSAQVSFFNEEDNEQLLALGLDLVDE
ncbi:uncharacterized protein LOC131232410 [Magnolia sinica]|uniref:uncharacterized protein LOC131232410 n=1 Tax=Magnolia sinica TaxID=86752 RepID=UPI002657B2A2|nr:uncharacterized protein LOC131232410 [Magnolia sinica]